MLDQSIQTLDAAIEAHKNGELVEASDLYFQILRENPHHPDANHNLGLLTVQIGETENAILFLENAINSNPNVLQYWVSFIDTLLKLNRTQDAEQILFQAKETGHDDPILSEISEVIKKEKKLRFQNNASNKELPKKEITKFVKMISNGAYAQAIKKLNKLDKTYKQSATLQNLKALAYSSQNKFEPAKICIEKALKLDPENYEYLMFLGKMNDNLGELDDAIDSYQKARTVNPNDPLVHFNLGVCLYQKDLCFEAIASYTRCIELDPKDSDAYLNLGRVYIKLDDAIKAKQVSKKAIELNPTSHLGYYNLAHVHSLLGEFDEARDLFFKVLDINPFDIHAHFSLSKLLKYDQKNAHLSAMLEISKLDNFEPLERGLLHFSIAKAYEDFSNLEDSYKHYTLANTAYREVNRYDPLVDRKFHQDVIKSNEFFKANALKPVDDPQQLSPIYILGMPRSGTTLIEQIISSHSNVAAAGELANIHNFGEMVITSGIYPSSDQLKLFRKSYLRELAQYSNNAKYVTDKLPHNFRYISLINAITPNSKIIHVKRNAAAVCWSNYTKAYGANSLSFTYNLDHLVDFYLMYEELMEFWESEYPDNILTVDYDELVENPEFVIRKMIDFVGIPWEDGCLEPHKNKRSVKTSSQHQVREKIYTGSSEKWKRFEPFLDGAFDKLISE